MEKEQFVAEVNGFFTTKTQRTQRTATEKAIDNGRRFRRERHVKLLSFKGSWFNRDGTCYQN
jgi:hypothetical protein